MAMDSGMTRNPNTKASWKGGQEPVEEVYDLGLRKRWEERKKVISLSWEDSIEDWCGDSGDA